jgi:Spy/CpxP family protein refolding chaperone
MRAITFIVCCVLAGRLAEAGEDGPASSASIDRYLFPPELVMQHHEAIGLDAAQRHALKEAILTAQAAFLDLQWQQQAELGKLLGLLRAHPVDESKAAAQIDALLEVESRIKRLHFELLVRIRNTLTPEQQAKLSRLRARPPGQ